MRRDESESASGGQERVCEKDTILQFLFRWKGLKGLCFSN